jgi:hypothetical protein
MSNSSKSCLWALKPGAENIAEQARTWPGRPVVKTFLRLLGHKDKENVWTGPAPPYLPPFWPKLNVICMYSLLMFKWTNYVKPHQFLPQSLSFSIKTSSFQASWSILLSPVWDTFQPGAPPLKYLVLLHQGVVFYSWFLGARRIGSWVGVSPLGSFSFTSLKVWITTVWPY